MPSWVKDKYGAKGERQWKAVYDSCIAKGGSQESCAKQASGVVRKTLNESFTKNLIEAYKKNQAKRNVKYDKKCLDKNDCPPSRRKVGSMAAEEGRFEGNGDGSSNTGGSGEMAGHGSSSGGNDGGTSSGNGSGE